MVWRYIAGGLAALLLIGAGLMLFSDRARSDAPLPAAPRQAAVRAIDDPLPDTVPQASDRTREQKRFDRYDKDRNGTVTREEYFAARRKAYAKLDTNTDGILSFEEWAAATTTRFSGADQDKSGSMSPIEFATTAPKRRAPMKRDCKPATAPRDADG